MVSAVLILLVGLSIAPSDAQLLGQAEAAFHKGVESRESPVVARAAFAEAAAHYEELRRRGIRTPALYANLGNAHLLAGDLPRAILSYRRGLLLAPNDPTLKEALRGARAQVVYPPPGEFGRPPREVLPPWLPRLTSSPVAVLALLGYITAWAALVRWWMVRRRRVLAVALVAIGLTLVTAAGWGLLLWYELEEDRHPFVVIAEDNVVLRTGNGLSYPAKYETPLNRGVEGRLLFERGDWARVEFADGASGWVRRDWLLVNRDEPR